MKTKDGKEMSLMSFASKLQELRTEHGVSQEELAEMLHVSRQSVSKWERGKVYPEIDKLIALSDYFGVSLDELLKEKKESAVTPRRPVNLEKESSQRTAYPENSADDEIYPQRTAFAQPGGGFRHEIVSDNAGLARYTDYSYHSQSSAGSSSSRGTGTGSQGHSFFRRFRARAQMRFRGRTGKRRLSVLRISLAALAFCIIFAAVAETIEQANYNTRRAVSPEIVMYNNTGSNDYWGKNNADRLRCMVDEKTGYRYVFDKGEGDYGLTVSLNISDLESCTRLRDTVTDGTFFCEPFYTEQNAVITPDGSQYTYVIPHHFLETYLSVEEQTRYTVGHDANHSQDYWIPNYILEACDEAVEKMNERDAGAGPENDMPDPDENSAPDEASVPDDGMEISPDSPDYQEDAPEQMQ